MKTNCFFSLLAYLEERYSDYFSFVLVHKLLHFNLLLTNHTRYSHYFSFVLVHKLLHFNLLLTNHTGTNLTAVLLGWSSTFILCLFHLENQHGCQNRHFFYDQHKFQISSSRKQHMCSKCYIVLMFLRRHYKVGVLFGHLRWPPLQCKDLTQKTE